MNREQLAIVEHAIRSFLTRHPEQLEAFDELIASKRNVIGVGEETFSDAEIVAMAVAASVVE